jgi:hypothetical protein
MCCLLCFDSSPVPDDPKAGRPNEFDISMLEALWKGQPACCVSYFCAPCAAYYVRYTVLEGDMSQYSCCQGYFNLPCFHAGMLGESRAPQCCLCVESCCCVGPSISASRLYVMDMYDLRSDPCDNRFIRFSNCLNISACICNTLAICFEELRECARLLDCIANIVFYCTIGCMAGQTLHEVKFRKTATGSALSRTNGNTLRSTMIVVSEPKEPGPPSHGLPIGEQNDGESKASAPPLPVPVAVAIPAEEEVS